MDYHARFYDAYLNRWTQPDNIMPDYKNPQALNRYAYALGNPIKNNDPTGHWVLESDKPDDEIHRNAFYDMYKRFKNKKDSLSSNLADYYQTAAAYYQARMDERPVDVEVEADLLKLKADNVRRNGWNSVVDAESAAGDVGLIGAPQFVAETGMGLAGIVITPGGLAHVIDNHTVEGGNTYGKSVFSSDVDVTDLIKQAEGTTPTQARNGNLVYVVPDAGRIVGIDRATGLPTSTYTVVTNSSDELVSAYPGRL